MSRLREQDGFTLVEMLVVCLLMIIVLTATLDALDVFGKTTATNRQVSDAQDTARNTLDRMTWELRNATAYQATTSGSAVTRSGPWDIIFKTVDPLSVPGGSANTYNVERVRYCLNTTTQTLYREAQTWTTSTAPNAPSDTACPGTGWPTARVVATNLVNGGTRRVFTYNDQDANDVNAPAPASADISAVRVSLFVDPNPGQPPAETSLTTGAFIRNQNRRPTAVCSATLSRNGHVFLNASASVDPEGGMLSYQWTDSTETSALDQTAANFDYVPATSGSHTFGVTVTDDSGLKSTATCAPDPVVVP